MITATQIYLIAIADNIIHVFSFVAIISLIGWGLCVIGFITAFLGGEAKERESKCKKLRIILCSIALIFGIISILIPSTKTLIAMYTIPSIVNNKEVQKLPANLLRFANDYLQKKDSHEQES